MLHVVGEPDAGDALGVTVERAQQRATRVLRQVAGERTLCVVYVTFEMEDEGLAQRTMKYEL